MISEEDKNEFIGEMRGLAFTEDGKYEDKAKSLLNELIDEIKGQKLPIDSVIVPKGTLPFEFVEWYSGMNPDKIRNAYNRWQKEKGNAL